MTFVAGNFIYIAADIWRNLLKNKKKVMNMVEIFMFALGVGLMFIVLLAESDSGHDHWLRSDFIYYYVMLFLKLAKLSSL